MKVVPPVIKNKVTQEINNVNKNISNKKTVSIIGTCVSKEMFNELRLSKIFNVEVFAFKTCPFALFDEPLNYPTEYIFFFLLAESQAVNVDYNINKTAIKALENKKSEYFFIDLYPLANDSIFEVEYNNKKTYVQLDWFRRVFDTINNDNIKNNVNIKYNYIKIDQIDENIIINGLKKLADWASKNYKNIVIVWPVLAKSFLNKESKIQKYSSQKLNQINSMQKIIDKYTELLSKFIKSAKVLKWKNDYYARLVHFDYFNIKSGLTVEPNFVHLLTKNYEDIATNLLKLLNLGYKQWYDEDLDFETMKVEKLKNVVEELKGFRDNNIEEVYCHIISYTNYLNKLKHHLIVISGKGDIKKSLRFYRNKNTLSFGKNYLKWNVLSNESYIAVIDTKNNFIYENHSADKSMYEYKVPNLNKSVYIESSLDNSSIKYGDVEHSMNQKGINFFILDLDNNEIIDSSYCDISNDEYMLVHSKLFEKFNK